MTTPDERKEKKAKDVSPALLSAEPGAPKQHFSIDVHFPVYAIDFVAEDVVLLAGGGGGSRTGVRNRLSLHKIDPVQRQLALQTEFELSKTEDAPMTVVVHPATKILVAGINSSLEKLKQGTNENLRVFSYELDSIKFDKAKQTIDSTDENHYQKVTAFSRSTPTLLAIGSTNAQLSLVSFPSLEPVWKSKKYDAGDEIYDVDFDDSGAMLAGTSSKKLCIWSTRAGADEEEPMQVIERPMLKSTLSCTFRAAKFGRGSTAGFLYTVVNSAPTVRTKGGDKKAFLSKWDVKTWKLVKTRTISKRPVTALDVSQDGSMLAFGSSDLSVGVLDAKTLRSITTILKAHDFPVTALRFNPSGTLLLSGSADNSVRVITIPPVGERDPSNMLWNLLWILLVVLIAVAVQRYGDERAWKALREASWL